MAKILNLIIQDRCDLKDPKEFVESYKIREGVENPEKALRDTIQEFLQSGTDESKAAISYACGCFNWGDAISSVPENLFIKHGLTPLKHDAVDVFVNHDEILFDDVTDASVQERIKTVIKEHINKGEKEIAYWSEGENLVAEGMANDIAEQNEKLKVLLALDEISGQTLTDLINSETDDNLVVIYENIHESLLDMEEEDCEN